MDNYCECGKTYKSENFPCICQECETDMDKETGLENRTLQALHSYYYLLETVAKIRDIIVNPRIFDTIKVKTIRQILDNEELL